MLKKKKYAKWANGDDGPDWGDLKHNEKEAEIALKKVKEVGNFFFINPWFTCTRNACKIELSNFYL